MWIYKYINFLESWHIVDKFFRRKKRKIETHAKVSNSFDSRHVSPSRDDGLQSWMYLPGTTVPWRAGPWTGFGAARPGFFADGTRRPAAVAGRNHWRRVDDNRWTRKTRRRSRASCVFSRAAAGTNAPATRKHTHTHQVSGNERDFLAATVWSTSELRHPAGKLRLTRGH